MPDQNALFSFLRPEGQTTGDAGAGGAARQRGLLGPLQPCEPTLDAAALSATAVISAPTPDRSDDIVEPLGVRLENYAKNPSSISTTDSAA